VGIIFSDDVRTVLPLSFNGSVAEKMQKILNAPHLGGATNTGGAIQEAYNVLKQNKRPDAPRAIVVITDGQSNRGPKPKDVADLAKSEGITMVSVGIGRDVYVPELLDIASSPSLAFCGDAWADLDKILVDIVYAMCPAPNSSSRTRRSDGANYLCRK